MAKSLPHTVGQVRQATDASNPEKKQYLNLRSESDSEWMTLSDQQRYELFNYVALKNPKVLKESIRISQKGISELSSSKVDDPLKNYQYDGHLGAGAFA